MPTDVNIIKTLLWRFKEDADNQYTNCALIFAYNGTGKTRLSYDFAHYECADDTPKHTLYYNAYTEDLFTWNNDPEGDLGHQLRINQSSQLIQGLSGYNFSENLHKYLDVFTDIDFNFHYDDNAPGVPIYVEFNKGEAERIKISRGEERLFVWCFFRCIMEQVINGNDAYKDIKYIYIDDPMSSLDDNNVILFAAQLYNLIKDELEQEKADFYAGREVRQIKFVVSSHHALFFHTMQHGLEKDKKLGRFFLSRNKQNNELILKDISDTAPFYYNVAIMSELEKAIRNDNLYTYHFNALRSVMEKIKEFFGHYDFRFILDGITYRGNNFDEESFSQGELTDLYSRMVNVFSHQYAMFAPSQMNDDSKEDFKTIFFHLKKKYKFILPDLDDERSGREIRNARRQSR